MSNAFNSLTDVTTECAGLNDENQTVDKEDETEESVNEVRFNPPVFKQRYAEALEVAKKHNALSIVDFGCAECKMLVMYKNILALTNLVGVDIDRELLELHGFRAKPMMHEFIVKPRNVELHAQVLCGSVADHDARLRLFDMVSAIELIEHLHPDVLEKVPATVFGFIQPKVALFTTPNAEFNKYFGFSPGQVRHWDHKFEWTRQEFERWCYDCCQSYPEYEVQFTQIGFLDFQSKEDREIETGGCSQMAVFTRKTLSNSTLQSEGVASDAGDVEQMYETVIDVCFPFDHRSKTERVINELSYAISRLTRESEITAECTGEPQKVEIKMEEFLQFPILSEQVDGDLQVIEEILQMRHEEEFSGIELLSSSDGTKMIVKWVYPYESSPSENDREDRWESNTDECQRNHTHRTDGSFSVASGAAGNNSGSESEVRINMGF